uniref:Uncharacterized protein n=1 Tax=Panagrolaimus sp. PS1159 TaxID=55785 RepID=A0AC35EUS7_9BILA
MGNIGYRSVFCQQSFLDQFNNGSIWRNPVLVPKPTVREPKNKTFIDTISDFVLEYTYTTKILTASVDGISLFLIIFLLIINQKKKVVDGFGLRIFVNNILGILLFRLFSRMALNFYEIIWNFLKYRIGYCVEKYYFDNGTIIETSFVFDPDNTNMDHSFIALKIFDFRIDSFLYANEVIARYALPCITMLQLFLHRTTIYAGISYPSLYQEFFTEKLLKLYYILIWLIFLTYRYGLYFQESELYSKPSTILTSLFAICHLIISVLSLTAVWKYQYTKVRVRI